MLFHPLSTLPCHDARSSSAGLPPHPQTHSLTHSLTQSQRNVLERGAVAGGGGIPLCSGLVLVLVRVADDGLDGSQPKSLVLVLVLVLVLGSGVLVLEADFLLATVQRRLRLALIHRRGGRPRTAVAIGFPALLVVVVRGRRFAAATTPSVAHHAGVPVPVFVPVAVAVAVFGGSRGEFLVRGHGMRRGLDGSGSGAGGVGGGGAPAEVVVDGTRGADSVEVELGDAEDAAITLAGLYPLGADNGDVHLDGLLPGDAAALGSDEVGGIDADAVDHLGADAVDGAGELLASAGGKDTGGNGDAAQVRHLVGADGDLLAGGSAGGGAQDEMEGVLSVDSKSADLGAVHLQGARDIPGLLAVAVEGQGDEVGGGEIDRVPLEDDGGLGSIAAAQDGLGGLGGAERTEDAVL